MSTCVAEGEYGGLESALSTVGVFGALAAAH